MSSLPPTTSTDSLCPQPNDATSLLGAHSPTPLPKASLAALCAVRIANPIAFTQVFPYINEFIIRLHVTDDPSRIGFYSGIVESSFAVAQLLSVYTWARVSDVVGRRPVVLIVTSGLLIATALFGISTSLAQLLWFRSIAGLCSGNVAVVQSLLAELTDSSNQALAYSIYTLSWPLGVVLGPLIGGSFSNPATRYPRFFDIPLWNTFPYLLPCLVSALLGFVGVALAYCCLNETLPSKCRGTESKSARLSKSYGTQDTTLSAPPSISVASLLSNPVIRALSTSGFALGFVTTAFDVVFVLFCYSPIQTGGLAFSASQTGYSLAVAGAISVSIQLLFLPSLLRTFGAIQIYSFCMGMWPLAFAALPTLNLLARHEFDAGTGLIPAATRAKIWVGITIVVGLSRVASLAYSISMILVKEYAPSPSLASANGLVLSCICLARAISPAFVSSMFVYSVDKNLLEGHSWALVMVMISFCGVYGAKNVGRCATVMSDRREIL